MKKYLIVDTFNGEGYSDSSAEIKEFDSKTFARNHAINLAQEFCSNNGSIKIFKDRVEYSINYDEDEEQFEDQGAVHFVELKADMFSITINPSINVFMIHTEDEDSEVRDYLMTSEESEDGEELEGTCHHLDDSVEIYFKIENL